MYLIFPFASTYLPCEAPLLRETLSAPKSPSTKIKAPPRHPP
jgi:hypothetical protein